VVGLVFIVPSPILSPNEGRYVAAAMGALLPPKEANIFKLIIVWWKVTDALPNPRVNPLEGSPM